MGRRRSGANGIHCWDNLNDGRLGNPYSWIPAGTDSTQAGVYFGELRTVVGFSVARDATGTYGDRTGGALTFEYTTCVGKSADFYASSASGWVSLGTVFHTAASST